MNPAAAFSPAKLNLFLAVTQRRADGFHDLVSMAAPLAWGDELMTAPADGFALECDDPAVPADETNLVLKAARAFREATGWRGGAKFRLTKRVPPWAGLGGGSSNGVTALRALNGLAGNPLGADALASLAVQLGSDCALFLQNGPVVMRGRGERLEPLPAAAADRRAAAEDALLVVSELVTNACLHAGGPEELRLRCAEDRVRIEVSEYQAQRSDDSTE